MNSDRHARQDATIALINANYQLPITELLDRVTAALHENFSHYTGVYIYLLEGETLVLNTFRGRPTEHTRIPIGAGICGRAARIKQTVTVDDVTRDAEYIACSLETRSEIVVPIMRGDRVFGEIDIDSDVPAAFRADDQKFLERVADALAHQFALN
ncbi:MAG: GAF domain-containing protein [Chloroflexi bacterium]|nr:GAF domain-containing protein [Chloroflexota bacterium]